MLASRSMRAQQQRVQNAPRSAAAAPRRRVLGLGTSLRSPLVVRASTVLPTPNFSSSSEDSGFSPSLSVPSAAMGSSVPHITMSGGMGSQSGLGATMERSRMNFVMPTPVVKGPKLDDGGDGGDIGKNNRNGGGGDGGGGDDDDWFGEEDGDGEGEGGDAQRGPGFFRAAVLESYDKLSLGAVFAEWMKTIQDLPAILRQAVQMGLFSSAQLVRFFSMDVRPGLTRSISRHLPPSAARDFVGRLMADPGFVQKMVLEAAFASCASLWYEFRARGDRFKDELDLALINTVGMAAATGATVWLLAPSRSYGSLQKMPWQQMLEGLPNCVFDVSGPLRSYTKGARAAGFLAKAAELSAVGALTGTATALLASAAVAVRQRADPEWQPSVPVPSVGRSSGGLAAFFALNANVRYQLIGGLDRFLFDRTTFLWTYVVGSGAARLASNQVGEVSRAWWQGLPDPRSLAAPAFLAGPALPITRRVRKKVSKRVPRSVLLQQQQQAQLALAQPATMAAVGAAALEATQQQQQPLLLEPLAPELSASADDAAAALQEAQQLHLSSSSAVAAAVESQPALAAEVQQSAAAAAVTHEPQVVQLRAVVQQQEAAAAAGHGPAAAAAQQQSEDDDDDDDDEESSGAVSSEEAPALQPQRRGAYAARH